MTPADSVDEVINRLCAAYGVVDEAALAERQQIDRITFRVWRTRGKVPSRTLVRCSQETGVEVSWLLGAESACGRRGASPKPHYRLNLDGSTTLLACDGKHFCTIALQLPQELTGLGILQTSEPEAFLAELRRQLASGLSISSIAKRLDMTPMKLRRVLYGSSRVPEGYATFRVIRGFKDLEARP